MNHQLECCFSLQRADFSLAVDMTLDLATPVGIIGETGAGKTTLIRVIAGLEAECQGQICFQGELWQRSKVNIVPTHRRSLGVVFQDSRLLPGKTVLENLAFASARACSEGPDWSRLRIIEGTGIDALLSRRVESLSGGERQRVALARALLSRPRLLLLDEPLSANDIGHRERIVRWLSDLLTEYQVPMLYISHSPEELQTLVQQVLHLQAGQVIDQGSAHSVLMRAGKGESFSEQARLVGEVASVDQHNGALLVNVVAPDAMVLQPGDRVTVSRSEQ